MHDDAYIGGRSENNMKCVVHDDLGWKNRTTRYILPRHWLYEWFSHFHRCGTYWVLSRSPSIARRFCTHCMCCRVLEPAFYVIYHFLLFISQCMLTWRSILPIRTATTISLLCCSLPLSPVFNSSDSVTDLNKGIAVAWQLIWLTHQANPKHRLANKTVVQLWPKSTTGSSFYWSIIGTFVGGYDPSPKNFSISHCCASCLCPFMLNISL